MTHNEGGFSLLELLVVLAILALLGVMTTTPALLAPSDGVRLQATAREFLQALRRGRSSAIARNIDIATVIDANSHTISWTAEQTLRFDPEVFVEMKIAAPERETPARGAFRFFADGSSTGGTITLGLKGKQVHICVDWLTGRAKQARQC